jgi:hypothetical protein
MTFEEAIVKSVKAYLEGDMPKELMEASKETKYTPEYFDELEKEITENPEKIEEVLDEE